MTRIAGISPASTIGTGACIAIGTLGGTMVRTTSCTGIDITAGTLVGITALMPDVTTTGTAARTMIGMVAVTMTSTWNHKSVLQPVLRDGHFVASSGGGLTC